MSTTSAAILGVFVVFALALLGAIAAERASRRITPPLGVPSPAPRLERPRFHSVVCSRCQQRQGADLYGRPLPHYPPHRTDELCGPRRIH